MHQIDNLDAFASGKELAQINDTQNRNSCDPNGVDLRLGGGWAADETKTQQQKLCLRVYAKPGGSEPAGPFFCEAPGFLSRKAVHTVSHPPETGTLGPLLQWLTGTAVPILCVIDT